jgi:pimeloyl-ACP methyl ester carboxylesterase
MLDLVDLILLRRGLPADDHNLTFRRIYGTPTSKVIYFLPWHTPFALARQAGFVPLEFLACYEMPEAIVSSEPELCLQALQALVTDAEQVFRQHRVEGNDALIVGLSVGTYPATYLANRIGARLCSVASADRADLAIWLSPATRIIKQRAQRKGYQLSHYSEALSGTHPAQNLADIASGSVFLIGQRDPFVPPSCAQGLLQAIAAHAPHAEIITPAVGHFRTLVLSGRFQRQLPGVSTRRRWQPLLSVVPTLTRPNQNAQALAAGPLLASPAARNVGPRSASTHGPSMA